jgi:CRP/FNR family cyclic AMP-dependent transcriptional regulator
VSEPVAPTAPELWNSFCQLGRSRNFRKGDIVFLEGDPPGDVYGVQRGRVKLVLSTRDGREVAVSHKQAGELFGEMAAIDGLPRSATALALDDASLIAVPPGEFMAFVERTPALAIPLLRMMAHRLRAANSHQTSTRTRSAVERVAAALVDLADRHGVAIEGRATVTLRQDDLAAWAGVNREAVSRALTQLRNRELVATTRGRIDLLDLARLRVVCDGA